MALESTLTVDKRNYSLLECEYEFTQSIDITGRPSDRPRGGVIHMVLVSPDDTDLTFHEWMREKDELKDGTIVLNVNSQGSFAKKTIQFTDAYCIRLYEYFNANNSMPMYTKVSIMAGTITFGDDCEFKMID